VLLKVRVPTRAPAEAGGDNGGNSVARVADVSLKYRDLAAGKDATCAGSLGVVIVKDAASASELDGLVRGRLSRSETAAALVRANELFEQGKAEEAQRLLDEHRTALEGEAAAATRAASGPRKGDLANDYKGQSAALSNASSSYGASAGAKGASSPQDTAAGRRAVRAAQMVANPYME
jgi:Ca-activated chloride channel homolog